MSDNQDTECQLCGSISKWKCDAYGYQAGTKFDIYFCENCQTSFSMPMSSASEIYDFIYNNVAIIPGYDRYWRYFKSIKEHAEPLQYLADSEENYWGVGKALKQIVKDKQNVEVLEIGSGLGYLTYALRENGYNVQGLDISQEAVEQAKGYFGDYYICRDLFDYAETDAGSYDVVILTEVIEHVDEPVLFLEAIMKLLKNDGHVILTTPNKSIDSSDVLWNTELPPVHQWWFSEESMVYLAKKLNVSFKFIDFKDFYKNNYKLYKIKRGGVNSFNKSIVDENWKLIRKGKPYKKKRIKSFLLSIPFVKFAYLKLKTTFNSNLILCAERGTCLCVVFKK